MTVGNIEILSLPVSLGSGEYPLLSSAGQSLSSYTLATVSGRFTEDITQTLKVPYFEGYSKASMVRMGGRLYWVMDVTTSTDTLHALVLHVSLCGPSSVMHKGSTLKGDFSRLPSNVCSWLPRQSKSGGLDGVRKIVLPKLETEDTTIGEAQFFYVQVTTTTNISAGSEGSLNRYGFFTAVNQHMNTLEVYIKDTQDPTTALHMTFPQLADFINNPAKFDFTASTILDISISVRCPYDTSTSTVAGGIKAIKINVDNSRLHTVKVGDYTYGFYDIDRYLDSFTMISQEISLNFSATERQTGSIALKDANSNQLAVFDPSITLTKAVTTCISDYGSLITQVEIGGGIYTIPEGHVPFVGSAWDEYRKYSLAYDRESMEQSIRFANERVQLGIAQAGASAVQGAALGFLGGGAGAAAGAIGGAASFAIQSWASLKEQGISEAEARSAQDLQERRVQGQAGTAYNAGYGLIYCWQNNRSPACVELSQPGGWTASIDKAYTDAWGFPAEGMRTVTVTEGYYKGRLYATNNINGYILDKCNSALMSGIKFKEV